MKTAFRKKFLKELAKLPKQSQTKIEKFVFGDIQNIKNLESSHKIEKMKGYASYYKIRFGDYRVGLKYENEVIIFQTVMHSRDIYRYFP
ncbi:MAG: type II toxin-antitoxin system RelE/ParE family toxin [Melioribacteraceae bacterium]|nr:type II toxin-antitoxin system RelE/ParE family toxin [Melioribacteraceae bacterium]